MATRFAVNASGQALHADGTACAPSISFACDTDTGFFRDANLIKLAVGGALNTTWTGGSSLVGDTGNGNASQGITINQAAYDDEILALKSSDVSHGITGGCGSETDTFFSITKSSSSTGGAWLKGISDAGIGIKIAGIAGCAITTDTSGSCGPIAFYPLIQCGSGTRYVGACENVFFFTDGANTRFLMKGDGDLHGADTSIASLDTHCDVGLIRALETTKRTEGIIKSKWDEHVRENICSLIDAGLYSVPPWEGGLLNLSQLWRLHNGAIWQLWTNIKDQSEELLGLRQQLNALQGGCP